MIKRSARRKSASLYGSSRGRFFSEKSASRPSLFSRRSQKIKVRHRYVATVLKDTGKTVWLWTRVGISMAAVVWMAVFLTHFWHTSPLLHVKEIKFYGDIPEKLHLALSIRPGQNILVMNTSREQKEILRQFPEIKDISIWRTPLRDVIVRGEYRIPVAVFEKDGQTQGIDIGGGIFPITTENPLKEKVPVVAGFRRGDLAQLMEAIQKLKNSSPDFYSLIYRLETDTMNNIKMELSDQIFLFWGQLEENDLVIKAQRVLDILNRFVPKNRPAQLRFITTNRLVIDANWMAKDEEKI